MSDSYFKKGMTVVKVIEIGGVRTATVDNKIAKVTKSKVTLEDCGLEYDLRTGNEIDPAIPGCYSYIVYIES